MSYGKLITRFGFSVHTFFGTGDENIIPTCREGIEVQAFCWTGDENIIPTCREAGNHYIL